MEISIKDRKHLWSAAAGICSYHHDGESCGKVLFTKNGEMDTNVGQECHIIGEKPAAARYQEDYKQKETYDNAILLCNIHHKIVDDNPELYTPIVLRQMKNKQEKIISDRVSKKEISPYVLKNCDFVVEDNKGKDEVIGLDIQTPTIFSGVKVAVRNNEARSVIGARISGPLNITMTTCPRCGNPVSSVYSGQIAAPMRECSNCHHRF